MTRGRKILLWLVGIAALIYGGFVFLLPTTTINYRLTIEAMTPDGPRIGSGVIQVSYSSDINVNGGGRKGSMEVTGEAIYLDLGGGKNLVVTLQGDGTGRKNVSQSETVSLSAKWLPVRIFGIKWAWGDEWSLESQSRAALATGAKEVPLVQLPMVVSFRNPLDPMSVVLLDPQDISEVLGPGYTLSKATIAITDAQPTEAIVKSLPWIENINGGYLHGGKSSAGSPFGLSGLVFKMEKGRL
jgi:hypothetical protein